MVVPPAPGRRAGLLVPLFSLASTRSWGIGEIPDIEPVARWLSGAGQRVLQLLPITELTPGDTSPYSAMSAMAIDPQFIALHALEDFAALGGEAALDPHRRAELERVRACAAVDYDGVRALKQHALRRAFAFFQDHELAGGTRRSAAFRAFADEQAWWLREYAVFRALHAHLGGLPWTAWPEPLRTHHPEAIENARRALADEILYREYLQWIAGDQWGSARDRACEVALFGDLPFMVSGDSADVWSRQDEFRMDASVGVPPDAFSDDGQDWQLPVYRWDIMAARDFDWVRARAQRQADLYDGYRLDHLVGFYRTYFRPHDASPAAFTPDDEDEQALLGERIIEICRTAGAEIIAEDLGTVPDFVRESLARLGVPGYKVFRWERHWHTEGHPFRDPVEYPAASVATSGTHDTEPMVVWWERATAKERRDVLAIPSLALDDADRERVLHEPTLSHQVHEALLDVLFASGSDLLILPIQDVFGWRERINTPATIGDGNWRWRLPWPSDRLLTEPPAMAVATQLREWSARHGRTGSPAS